MPQNAMKSPRGLPSVRRPLVLTSEVTVAANSTKSPDLLRLKNPTGEHFMIREIRFSLRVNAVDSFVTGGAVAVKLELGTQAITNAHVPVWSFGRYISRDADGPTDGFTFRIAAPSFFRWKLKHPLYVPAGAGLACEFQHRGTVRAPITAAVTYIGHTPEASVPPRRVKLPWVAAYSSKIFNRPAADADVSSAAALLNPFEVPIYLERFTGRLNFIDFVDDLNYAFEGNRTVQLRARHSSGAPLVREFAPFRQVFGAYSHSWEQHDSVLEPGASYLIEVNKLADAGEEERYIVQADVGMLGWRDLGLVGSGK